MAYAQRYAGGFADSDVAKPVDQTFLNAVEAALLALFDANPASAGMVPVWTPAGTHYVPGLLTNASIDPAAAIAKSKLAALNITDADVAGAAAIAKSKLALAGSIADADINVAAAIQASKIAGGAVTAPYKKATVKTVNTTVAATDLLNGEFTLAAGAMGASSVMRLRATGTLVNNSGAAQTAIKFQFVLGGTTIIDTGIPGFNSLGAGANILPWEVEILVQAQAATNAQFVTFRWNQVHLTSTTGAWVPGTGTGVVMGGVENNAGFALTHGLIYNTGTKDLTAAQALVLNVINPSASASFSTVLNSATVEIL